MADNRIFSYLVHEFTEPIRDPLWQNIYLESGFKRLISLEPFQKLGRIKQLGPAFHVYPGAVHTRLNHSLGVFHLSRKLLLSLLDQAENIPVTLEGVKSFLAAALLHDLGHFPYAHSFKELPLKDHEELTAEQVLSDPIASALKEWIGADPQMVAEIVDEKLKPSEETEVPLYRRFLSGVLDPDKLDYLNRDAYFCGVPYGIQDSEFILHKIRLHSDRGIAIESDGITAVENLLFSKYLMYRTVYWHRVVRIATAMIKQAVFLGMQAGKIIPSQLYWLDDEEFYRRFSAEDFAPLALIPQVMHRNFFKTAYEIPFQETNPAHLKLTELEERFSQQERMASFFNSQVKRTIHPHEVIIDIPEPISFEIDLPIIQNDSYVPFVESGSVFSGPVVGGFTGALRKVRLYLPDDIAKQVREPEQFFV